MTSDEHRRATSQAEKIMTGKQPHEYDNEVWGLAKLANDSGVPMTIIAKELEVSRASVQQRIHEVAEDINAE